MKIALGTLIVAMLFMLGWQSSVVFIAYQSRAVDCLEYAEGSDGKTLSGRIISIVNEEWDIFIDDDGSKLKGDIFVGELCNTKKTDGSIHKLMIAVHPEVDQLHYRVDHDSGGWSLYSEFDEALEAITGD